MKYVATYKHNLLTGYAREYYKNGILKSEIEYKRGKRDGMAKFYYTSGLLMAKVFYKDGIETGEKKFYDKNGILVSVSSKIKKYLRALRRYDLSQ